MALNKYYSTSDLSTYGVGDISEVEGILNSNLQGIFGIPYQFLPDVDPRPEGSHVGAMYAKKILSKMPLLFLTPCRQVFLPGADDSTRESVLNELLGSGHANIDADEVRRYYTVEFAYDKYYKYVNPMCRQLCYFTKAGDNLVKTPKGVQKLKHINWYDVKNDAFSSYFAADKAVVFYLDGYNTTTDSFSNTTMESSLASTINGFRDQANELRFLLGPNSVLSNMLDGGGDIINSISSGLSGTVGNLAGGLLGQLANTGVNTIVQGGKIIFPKLWQDFQWNRSSFSFSIKLRSPDHDTTSIILNVLIPYIHLLGMVLPIGLEEDPNAFISPFLVKAYSKGMFNIDMGLITGLTATKGAECQWNDDGLPTQIDIDLEIEDLYSSLFMTPLTKDDGARSISSMYHVARNTAMMDFLANMAGLNIADQEIARSWRMYAYLVNEQIRDIPSNIWQKFDTKVANFMSKLYK